MAVSKSFELLRSTATTVDFQKIKLQEIEDDTSEAGRIPRTVEVELHEDLVDTCIPGTVRASIVLSTFGPFAKLLPCSSPFSSLCAVCTPNFQHSRALMGTGRGRAYYPAPSFARVRSHPLTIGLFAVGLVAASALLLFDGFDPVFAATRLG